jgi:septum site-determining protein MinC
MNHASAGSREPLVELRFGPVGLAQVRIRTTDPDVVHADLTGRVATAPKMFERMAVALDLNELDHVPPAAAMRPVLEAVRRAGFVPVGFARGSEALDDLARGLDMPVLMQFRANRSAAPVPTAGVPMTPAAAAAARRAGLNRAPADRDAEATTAEMPFEAAPEPEPAAAPPARARKQPAPQPASAPAAAATPARATAATRHDGAVETSPALMHAQPVRSGQRIYARNRDLVVTATVGAGAEVMADGCVHVYGSLRGRAMAGTRGDTTARVFCQEFHAELVSIAGVFRVFETIPPELEGRPVQAWLDGEDLRFARIG